MSIVTLSAPYIVRIAQTYRLLRKGDQADPAVLAVVQAAAERCLAAHMRDQLRLEPDVKLPLRAVLMMLQYVHQEATARLAPVPLPEDLAPQPLTERSRGFLRAAMTRLQQLVAA